MDTNTDGESPTSSISRDAQSPGERSDSMPQFGDAAGKVNIELWVERNKHTPGSNSSARHDVLQEIWSRIVHKQLPPIRNSVLDKMCGTTPDNPPDGVDTQGVDEIVFLVCQEYSEVLDALEDSQKMMTPLAFKIVGKHLDEYREAVRFCRHGLISDKSKSIFGILEIGARRL